MLIMTKSREHSAHTEELAVILGKKDEQVKALRAEVALGLICELMSQLPLPIPSHSHLLLNLDCLLAAG